MNTQAQRPLTLVKTITETGESGEAIGKSMPPVKRVIQSLAQHRETLATQIKSKKGQINTNKSALAEFDRQYEADRAKMVSDIDADIAETDELTLVHDAVCRSVVELDTITKRNTPAPARTAGRKVAAKVKAK